MYSLVEKLSADFEHKVAKIASNIFQFLKFYFENEYLI